MAHRRRERRVHICFVTENREYHVREDECMAVRDCKSKVWIAGHKAIGMRLRPLPPGGVYLGKKLFFYSPGAVVETSAVVDISRPGRKQVNSYGFVHGFFPDDESLTG